MIDPSSLMAIIYNRTDCCVNRLSNYQVSISNKADFSTHIYQQDFHVAPNPRKIIQLDASGSEDSVYICAGLCGMFSKG
jgi:hypothetical protein